MHILFLDSDFKPCSAPIDNYISLVWTLGYYEDGTFSAVLKTNYFLAANYAEYVYNSDIGSTMRIDTVSYSSKNMSVSISGRSLSSILDDRVITNESILTGNTETMARFLVSSNAISGNRQIAKLSMPNAAGFTYSSDADNALQGKRLSEKIRDMLKPHELSYEIEYDYASDTLNFKIWQGINRSQEQSANPFAVFSTNFENLGGIEYTKNRRDYANTAIKLSSVVLDLSGSTPKREIYLSGDEIASEILAEKKIEENVTGDVYDAVNLIYGINYGLGDICDIYDDNSGISIAARITSIDIVYELGNRRIIPHFGEGSVCLRKKIKSIVKG